MKQISYKETVENLRTILEEYIVKANLKSLVLGISGGIDSAVVAVLVKPVVDKLGIPLIGRSITIGTNSPEEISRAKAIGELFCSDFKEVDLTTHFDTVQDFDETPFGEKVIDTSYKIRMGNFKARMRMMYLYNLASQNGGLVLSTDNMTELLLGFWTLHGDVGNLKIAGQKVAFCHYPDQARELAEGGKYNLVFYGHHLLFLYINLAE
jgi:NAD+ synthetase